MGLRRYRSMRDFAETPEPGGEPEPGSRGQRNEVKQPARIFVVQEHDARRHHFDFRLEWRGVLKSWAVPKGPSTVPGEKRLAVEVEDHPIPYAEFEGAIPEGHYGAGAVALWDRGTWEPEGDVDAGLRDGQLKFRLEGKKLLGRWVLVRLKPRKDRDERQPNWLLIKEKSDETPNVTLAAAPASTPKPVRTKAKGKVDPMPSSVAPVLCTLSDRIPAEQGWVFELKLDGYRLMFHKDGKNVRVDSRAGHDWTARFPHIAEAVSRLPTKRTVIDGEVCLLDAQGHPSFEELVEALHAGRDDEMVYYAFDLLYEGNDDLRNEPLVYRKERLAQLLRSVPPDGPLRYVEHVAEDGRAFLDAVGRLGLEGMVAKRADSRYVSGRSGAWLKIKHAKRQEVVIVGYTPPRGKRVGIGALLAGVRDEKGRDEKGFRFAGKIGTGFSERTALMLRERLSGIEIPKPPLVEAPRERDARWVEPKLVAEVSYREWTKGGRMRHPSFVALREDKDPNEVVQERPEDEAATKSARPAAEKKPNGRGVEAKSSTHSSGARLTNPDKVLDRASGLTKKDLSRYYETMSERLLAFGRKRPLSLVRCPEGVEGEKFFQKHRTPGMGDDIHEGKVGEERVLFVVDEAGLLALAQFGTLELHGWGAKLARPEKPDVLVMDLDPDQGLAWPTVADAAIAMRRVLKDLGIESYLKTTGGKGLHVVVPLAPVHDWPHVAAFSEALALHFAQTWPDRYTATARIAARKGRIFVDHLRNRRGSTAVLPFSPRARPGLPVAMPIPWSEVRRVDPGAFNLRTVPQVLRRRRDPWADYFESPQRLPKGGLM